MSITQSARTLRSEGFTLIEVLIAMLILAIGVLGISALQYKGLQYNLNATYRTQINFLAYDIIDRMHLNKANAAAYATSLGTYTVPTSAPTGCNQTGTSAVGQTNDLACWKLLLYNSLPPGTVARITDNGSSIYTVSITWTDRQNESHTQDYTFQP